MCYLHLGELDQARDHIARSLRLFDSIGERYGHTLARCVLTKLHFDASRPREAIECGTATLRDALATDDHGNAALSLIDLVEIRRHGGDRRDAVRDTERAVRLARAANRPHIEAHTLIALAEAHLYDTRLETASAQIAAARKITHRYGLRLLDGLALTVLGEIRRAAGAPAAAAAHGQAALAIHHETGYRLAEIRTRALLGQPTSRHG